MFTVEQVATQLNLSVNTIRRYVKSGKIRGSKLGKSWRISAEQIKDFIEKNSN